MLSDLPPKGAEKCRDGVAGTSLRNPLRLLLTVANLVNDAPAP